MWYLFLLYTLGFTHPAQPYYASINKAEMHLVAGDYERAMQCYDSAFAWQQLPLGQDLYNASLCAVMLKDYARAQLLCLRLSDKGVGLPFFARKACYAPLRKRPDWPAFAGQLEQRQKNFLQRNRDNISYLQGLRQKSDEAGNRFTADLQNGKNREEFSWVSDSLAQVFLAYLKSHDYPSEEQFGLAIKRDTLIDNRPVFDFIMSRRPPQVNVRFDSVFRNIFFVEGVHKGKLKPELCLELLRGSFSFDDECARSYYSWYGNDLYVTTWVSRAKTDSLRADRSLIPLEDYLKKIRFIFAHPGSPFSLNVFLVQQKWQEQPADQEERYLRAHKLLIANITPDNSK